MEKSIPPLEDRAPSTFSQRIQAEGCESAIRQNSWKSPERFPSRPVRGPATERSWQGEPPAMMSTGASSSVGVSLMSRQRGTPGQRYWRRAQHWASSSTCQATSMPASSRAPSSPPHPEKREPTRSGRYEVLREGIKRHPHMRRRWRQHCTGRRPSSRSGHQRQRQPVEPIAMLAPRRGRTQGSELLGHLPLSVVSSGTTKLDD
jgi:hypothetical protein